MSFELQSQTPRSQVIFAYTERAKREHGMCLRKFASRVAEQYQHRVPAIADRIIAFHVGTTIDAACAAEKANAQIVTRILNGTVKLPADLEESWVHELPEPLRTECARDLARRYGFAAAQLPAGEGNPAAGIAGLASEFGDTMRALAPLLADGKIDEFDSPEMLDEALKQGTDLMAAWLGLQQAIVHARSKARGMARP